MKKSLILDWHVCCRRIYGGSAGKDSNIGKKRGIK
jgi:hypothetical protein